MATMVDFSTYVGITAIAELAIGYYMFTGLPKTDRAQKSLDNYLEIGGKRKSFVSRLKQYKISLT